MLINIHNYFYDEDHCHEGHGDNQGLTFAVLL